MRLGPAAMILLVAGSVTADAQVAPAESAAYLACNRSASRAVSSQAGDPVSLAVAARSLCAREELALRNTVFEGRKPEQGERLMRMYRAEVLEANTGWIVAYRSRIPQPR